MNSSTVSPRCRVDNLSYTFLYNGFTFCTSKNFLAFVIQPMESAPSKIGNYTFFPQEFSRSPLSSDPTTSTGRLGFLGRKGSEFPPRTPSSSTLIVRTYQHADTLILHPLPQHLFNVSNSLQVLFCYRQLHTLVGGDYFLRNQLVGS